MGSEEIRSRNGNGKPSLSCANTLVAQIERVPEEAIPGMQISPERPPGDKLEPIVKLLLEELGVGVESQHFRETPARVARFYREFTRGLSVRPQDILKTFRSPAQELVVVSGIDFFSLCPHHLLVYGGKVHFGYVPNGRIVGVSKIPRLIQALAAQPIVQEEFVTSIADAFMSVVKPSGCIVKAVGKHDCVAVRGVRCPSMAITAVAKRGIFEQQRVYVEEFDRAISEGNRCVR